MWQYVLEQVKGGERGLKYTHAGTTANNIL